MGRAAATPEACQQSRFNFDLTSALAILCLNSAAKLKVTLTGEDRLNTVIWCAELPCHLHKVLKRSGALSMLVETLTVSCSQKPILSSAICSRILIQPCGKLRPLLWLGTPRPALKHARSFCCMAQSQGHLWALDFDGVVCDSVGESSITAWKVWQICTDCLTQLREGLMSMRLLSSTSCCRLLAGNGLKYFNTEAAQAAEEKVLEGMRVCRPVIETG